MICDVCYEDVEQAFIARTNYFVEQQMCASCAQADNIFCDMHQEVHFRYSDGLSACAACIDEALLAYDDDADKTLFYITLAITNEDHQRLIAWAKEQMDKYRFKSVAQATLFGVMRESFKRKRIYQRIVADIISAKSIDLVID